MSNILNSAWSNVNVCVCVCISQTFTTSASSPTNSTVAGIWSCTSSTILAGFRADDCKQNGMSERQSSMLSSDILWFIFRQWQMARMCTVTPVLFPSLTRILPHTQYEAKYSKSTSNAGQVWKLDRAVHTFFTWPSSPPTSTTAVIGSWAGSFILAGLRADGFEQNGSAQVSEIEPSVMFSMGHTTKSLMQKVTWKVITGSCALSFPPKVHTHVKCIEDWCRSNDNNSYWCITLCEAVYRPFLHNVELYVR